MDLRVEKGKTASNKKRPMNSPQSANNFKPSLNMIN